jgi:hypothetical protein
MIQCRRRARFLLKATETTGIGREEMWQKLDCHLAAKLAVFLRYTSIPPSPSKAAILVTDVLPTESCF